MLRCLALLSVGTMFWSGLGIIGGIYYTNTKYHDGEQCCYFDSLFRFVYKTCLVILVRAIGIFAVVYFAFFCMNMNIILINESQAAPTFSGSPGSCKMNYGSRID